MGFLVTQLVGCAKLGYLLEQGVEQLRLQANARDNEQVLADPTVAQGHKEQVQQIAKYKGFFYRYFKRQPTDIYSKTVFLATKAVSHLVVASKYDEVKALEHCFGPWGCFPYLGLFKEKSAQKLVEKLRAQEFYAFRRPVYAYSTLGYFNDAILSSFFHYDEFRLAELVFHELFHTLFFVKDQVELNENLANYFSQQLAMEFFQDRPELVAKKRRKLQQQQRQSWQIVQLAREYRQILHSNPPGSKAAADSRLEDFLAQRLRPALEKICKEDQLESCVMAKRSWNNASFSAYLTYQDNMRPIAQLHQHLGGSLKAYLEHIEHHYKNYRGEDFKYFLLAQKK